jgi:hypothetical protein
MCCAFWGLTPEHWGVTHKPLSIWLEVVGRHQDAKSVRMSLLPLHCNLQTGIAIKPDVHYGIQLQRGATSYMYI